MELGAKWVNENCREEMTFKLDFERQIKMCPLEGVVRARFPGRGSSMNRGINIHECGVYQKSPGCRGLMSPVREFECGSPGFKEPSEICEARKREV